MRAVPGDELHAALRVEREFQDGRQISVDGTGTKTCLAVVDSNLADQVTRIHSCVSTDKKKTFCVDKPPGSEAIRLTASALPSART